MTASARRFHFIYAALLLMLAMATFLILGRANAYSPEGKRVPLAKSPAASEHDMAMRSAMGINLAEGRDLLTTYSGETGITQLLEQNLTQPLALTSADFDEDGVPDLLSGYAGAGKGILTLHRGNVDLLFSNSPQSKSHNGEATITVSDAGTIDRSVPAYFLAAARVFDLSEPADFLGAGDFDADGHWDVVAAAHGSNKLAGIMMSSGAANNRLEGNLIGTDVSGTVNLGNAFYGIQMAGAGTGNRIGGTVPGAGNTIAFNGGPGVNSNISMGNAIRGNSIFSNGGLGIEHGGSGVNANDPYDSSLDNVQNFPVITSVMTTGTGTLINGTLNSKPNSQFAIDFFANHSCDFLGNGQGETFIGSITITTDASCNASFSAVLPVAIVSGQIITATATSSNNNTSEFSPCFPQITVSGLKLSTVTIQGKNLIVTGERFDNGVVILLNGEAQKTIKDEQDPEARLIGKKVGKKIAPGQTVSVQVRNSDGALSNQIIFTRIP